MEATIRDGGGGGMCCSRGYVVLGDRGGDRGLRRAGTTSILGTFLATVAVATTAAAAASGDAAAGGGGGVHHVTAGERVMR